MVGRIGYKTSDQPSPLVSKPMRFQIIVFPYDLKNKKSPLGSILVKRVKKSVSLSYYEGLKICFYFKIVQSKARRGHKLLLGRCREVRAPQC